MISRMKKLQVHKWCKRYRKPADWRALGRRQRCSRSDILFLKFPVMLNSLLAGKLCLFKVKRILKSQIDIVPSIFACDLCFCAHIGLKTYYRMVQMSHVNDLDKSYNVNVNRKRRGFTL